MATQQNLDQRSVPTWTMSHAPVELVSEVSTLALDMNRQKRHGTKQKAHRNDD